MVISHIQEVNNRGARPLFKENAKFIDREVTKWSEMIKDWEEGVEIFGAALIEHPFLSHLLVIPEQVLRQNNSCDVRCI